MTKTILQQLHKVISDSPLSDKAVDDFINILESAELNQQKTFLALFKEDPTLAAISYTNVKKKQQALESDDPSDSREVLASEFDLLTSL